MSLPARLLSRHKVRLGSATPAGKPPTTDACGRPTPLVTQKISETADERPCSANRRTPTHRDLGPCAQQHPALRASTECRCCVGSRSVSLEDQEQFAQRYRDNNRRGLRALMKLTSITSNCYRPNYLARASRTRALSPL